MNKRMNKLRAVVCCLLLLPLAPSVGWGHYHGGVALAWGMGGLFLGSALTAAAYRQPSVVYVTSPPPVTYQAYQPPVTTYAPVVPPGMCRWERYVLDQYGSVLYDRAGNPLKEYTLGSCQYPPN